MNKGYTIVTLEERPDLKGALNHLHNVGWVKFMRMDPIALKYWNKLLTSFPMYQYVLLNNEEETIACGNAIPFYWEGSNEQLPAGWDDVFETGMMEYQKGIHPNTLSALAIVIHPNFRGKELSKLLILKMKDLAIANRLDYMVAPVRPSLKHLYPLIPMEDYVMLVRDDGTHFDPWIRTHIETGASIIKVAEKSMVITGSIEEWENWIDLKLPMTGKYIIHNGLVPLDVDVSKNWGAYVEPNVWLKHELKANCSFDN